jgi:hypothetical protein
VDATCPGRPMYDLTAGQTCARSCAIVKGDQSVNREGSIMSELARVGGTSGDDGCPTIYITERGTLVVQGTTVTDPQALAEIRQHGNGIPDYESCVEIPAQLLPFIDIDALQRVAFGDTGRPGFVINADAVADLRQRFEASVSETV